MNSMILNSEYVVLAERVRGSDNVAFKILFDDLWSHMASYASSIIDDAEVSKDILQDVWMDYWKRREDIQVQNIQGYLYKALRNACYKYIRDNKLTSLQQTVVDTATYDQETIDSEEKHISRVSELNLSLNNLPERCREIFLLSRLNDFTNEEIAKSLNITKKTVENQISIALKKLRKDLNKVSSILCSIF